MFSRENRRPTGAKSKHIFEIKEGRRGVEVVGLPAFIVSTGAGFRGCRTCKRLRWSSGRVFRCFCPLPRFVFVGLSLKYAFIRVLRAFLARFGVVVWVCVVLVLCVACVAFVCVSG